ncbi:MAG: hypothetical protein HKO62_12665 [Gammaproteobacteria bacterium]|nr:hypothetical protein [Gammaproteobacteria bacterium]
MILALACLAAVAQNDAGTALPDGYGAVLREEVLEAARDDWRRSQEVEQGWRAPAPPERSRMRFGADDAYDRLYRGDSSVNDGSDLRDPRPNTLFRLDF